jgi:hypothetical protein
MLSKKRWILSYRPRIAVRGKLQPVSSDISDSIRPKVAGFRVEPGMTPKTYGFHCSQMLSEKFILDKSEGGLFVNFSPEKSRCGIGADLAAEGGYLGGSRWVSGTENERECCVCSSHYAVTKSRGKERYKYSSMPVCDLSFR